MVPVAATSSVTSPVVAVAVRYSVAAVVLPNGRLPPRDRNTATPPATSRTTMADSLSFMGAESLHRMSATQGTASGPRVRRG